jgi:hypothetical protein
MPEWREGVNESLAHAVLGVVTRCRWLMHSVKVCHWCCEADAATGRSTLGDPPLRCGNLTTLRLV